MSTWEHELSKIRPASGRKQNPVKPMDSIEIEGRSFIRGVAYAAISKVSRALDDLGYFTQQSCGDESCNLFVDESGENIFKINIAFVNENGICRPLAIVELSPKNVARQTQTVYFGSAKKNAQSMTSDDVGEVIVEWFAKISARNP